VNVPTPSPLLDPVPLQLTEPVPVPRPNERPSESPRPPGAPRAARPPTIPTHLDPVPPIGPVPKEALNRCNCPPKKPAKKREPRVDCKRGTYRQTARGIIYNPKEAIPCQ